MKIRQRMLAGLLEKQLSELVHKDVAVGLVQKPTTKECGSLASDQYVKFKPFISFSPSPLPFRLYFLHPPCLYIPVPLLPILHVFFSQLVSRLTSLPLLTF